MTLQELLEQAKKLNEARTQGEWRSDKCRVLDDNTIIASTLESDIYLSWRMHNADFIAFAANHLSTMIAVIETAMKGLEQVSAMNANEDWPTDDDLNDAKATVRYAISSIEKLIQERRK